MKYSDLRRQILNLGFETAITYDEELSIIPDAINLAMRDITNLFPLVGEYKISQYPLENRINSGEYCREENHYSGDPLVYSADNVKSYYFECDGSGTATIKDNSGETTVQLISNHKFVTYSGFVNGNTTITFSGDYSYNIKNIAMYSEKTSPNVEDIPPFKTHAYYNFEELTKENNVVKFIEFMDKVQEDNNHGMCTYKHISDFNVQDRKTIILDGRKKAQFTIFYKKTFTEFTTLTDEDFEIELQFAHQHLLPLLASYYIWLDDDATKASLYFNKYEDSVSIIRLSTREVIATIESTGDI